MWNVVSVAKKKKKMQKYFNYYHLKGEALKTLYAHSV